MKIASLFSDTKLPQAIERAMGPVEMASLGGVPVLSVPAPHGVRYLISVEDRDIGTVQTFLKLIMDEQDADE